MASVKTMKAVVFNGVKDVSLQERSVPQLQKPGDIIVKVQYTALCGRYVAGKPKLMTQDDD
jgi:threonine dehydrogenase-like Zn-dependent dehydrogenase